MRTPDAPYLARLLRKMHNAPYDNDQSDERHAVFESLAMKLADKVLSDSPAVALGRRGGKVKSAAKSAAARANGAKGGRPPKDAVE